MIMFSSILPANNTKNNFRSQTHPIASFINEQRFLDCFINMAKIDSGSNNELVKIQHPSTDGQKNMAKMLHQELKKMGLSEVHMDENFIVSATLESNIGKDAPVVGFLAHMDTSPDAPSVNINPQVHNYQGGDIKLEEGTVISAKDLKGYEGQKIITSDGKTLLGADDKAGIAEILEALHIFQEHPELKRPKIRVAFTIDEETGVGINSFNIKHFGADAAYTIDGDFPHVIENESFNAFNPAITIKGVSSHSGYAKGKMKNSIEVAHWIMNKLPKNQTPAKTEKKQGYFHVKEIDGKVSETKLNMLVRDHSSDKIKKRMDFLSGLIEKARVKFGCEIEFLPKESYHNMKSKLDELPEATAYAKEAIRRSGLTPKTLAIRGGTDGSELSLKGLPTPNIGTGGHNYHSKAEFLVVPEALKSVENILNLAGVWAEKAKKVMPKLIERRKI